MTPAIFIALLKRLPGRPLLHCYGLLLLPFLLNGLAVLVNSPWTSLVFTACFIAFTVLFTFPIARKQLVDQRDYAISRAITGGMVLLVYPAGAFLLYQYYLGSEASTEWLFIAAVALTTTPFAVFRYVRGFHRAAALIPNWNTPCLVNPDAMESS